jgi:NAD binding domain of 6-phosphogluconate dehydrogenase
VTDYSTRLAGINVGNPVRPTPSGDFGLIGLAVMGQNLILNIADHGFTVVAYNRTVSKVHRFLENEAKGAYTNNLPVHPTLIVCLRQINCRGRFGQGPVRQAQETSPRDAPRHGREAGR